MDSVAIVEAWARDVPEYFMAIIKQSTIETVSIMQEPVAAGGNMPVDLGFLRASLMASTASMPTLTRSNESGASFNWDAAQVTLAIMGLQPGEKLHIGYTANYAEHQEYGSNGRAGRGFVRLAAQRWPQTVASVQARLGAQLGIS